MSLFRDIPLCDRIRVVGPVCQALFCTFVDAILLVGSLSLWVGDPQRDIVRWLGPWSCYSCIEAFSFSIVFLVCIMVLPAIEGVSRYEQDERIYIVPRRPDSMTRVNISACHGLPIYHS